MSLHEKTEKLKSLIQKMDRVLVAFSGGVDSTLVLAIAQEVLGSNTLAATAQSDSLPNRERDACHKLAQEIGAEHLIIRTNEMNNPNYQSNPANRCYHCKTELYTCLKDLAQEKSIPFILNGINTDDLGDYRPGIDAARENAVRSPLVEAGFNKQNVRDLARQMELSIWDKPAMACLSSRIPYGEPVTREKLKRVEEAEDLLLSMGFKQLRVRHHGDTASIELEKNELPQFTSAIEKTVTEKFKALGFQTTHLDPKGYRMGSLNEALEEKKGL
jgi:pyridinium-3,5-biscarboxylic acid mononucleotide sulfurtransferase